LYPKPFARRLLTRAQELGLGNKKHAAGEGVLSDQLKPPKGGAQCARGTEVWHGGRDRRAVVAHCARAFGSFAAWKKERMHRAQRSGDRSLSTSSLIARKRTYPLQHYVLPNFSKIGNTHWLHLPFIR
jgi:hypothetical protein